jgi:hypothetical protein
MPRLNKKDYDLNPNYCLDCNNKIEFYDSYSNSKKRKFCDSKCAAKFNNKNREPIVTEKYGFVKISDCLNCGNSCNNKGAIYCSNYCQHEHKHKLKIDDWKKGKISFDTVDVSATLRRYLFEKFDSKCIQCGWNQRNEKSGNIPLEVHHINGNHKDNSEENLTLLCPNCHSLTPTYKSLNYGKGRKERYKKNS